jgi:hypothetical protein
VLSLSPGLGGAALALLDSSRTAAAMLGARHLYSHPGERSDETLERLLHHTSEEVRRVAVAAAVTHYENGYLEDLLDRYTSAGALTTTTRRPGSTARRPATPAP